MARFVNMDNDNEIIDFNNMTVKQFRFLVGKAMEINNKIKAEKWDYIESQIYQKIENENAGDRI